MINRQPAVPRFYYLLSDTKHLAEIGFQHGQLKVVSHSLGWSGAGCAIALKDAVVWLQCANNKNCLQPVREACTNIRIAAQYEDDDRVVLGFSKFGCGGVRAKTKLGKGVNRIYVPNTVMITAISELDTIVPRSPLSSKLVRQHTPNKYGASAWRPYVYPNLLAWKWSCRKLVFTLPTSTYCLVETSTDYYGLDRC